LRKLSQGAEHAQALVFLRALRGSIFWFCFASLTYFAVDVFGGGLGTAVPPWCAFIFEDGYIACLIT
jgi:hypothetical protein